jgi:hypothetical protein
MTAPMTQVQEGYMGGEEMKIRNLKRKIHLVVAHDPDK